MLAQHVNNLKAFFLLSVIIVMGALVLVYSNPIHFEIPAFAFSGSGTANYLAKWIDSSTLGDSIIRDDGTYVGIGTAPDSSYKLKVNGALNVLGNILGSGSTNIGWTSSGANMIIDKDNLLTIMLDSGNCYTGEALSIRKNSNTYNGGTELASFDENGCLTIGSLKISGTTVIDSSKNIVNAGTGIFSGGIEATTGDFSGGITTTTGVFSSGITGTTGVFDGAFTVGSLASDGEITADSATISNDLTAASITGSGWTNSNPSINYVNSNKAHNTWYHNIQGKTIMVYISGVISGTNIYLSSTDSGGTKIINSMPSAGCASFIVPTGWWWYVDGTGNFYSAEQEI